jgi:hypothetical protein
LTVSALSALMHTFNHELFSQRDNWDILRRNIFLEKNLICGEGGTISWDLSLDFIFYIDI